MHTNMAPLWQLCRDGKLAEVREALARGEDVNSKADEDEEGFLTALMGAIIGGGTEIVKLLLEQPTVDLNYSDTSGQTALDKAARKDNVEAVKMLLADSRLTTHNHKDITGWTPAMSAAYWKRAGTLRELVAHPSVNLDTMDKLEDKLERIIREARQRRQAARQQEQQEYDQVCIRV